ncbi:hypothetical protein CLAFUW4_01610 [Fulvia fulva]|uniref:uncharacterized protein n=1 Tax=Passalora fulva TaxID=5499 RepID=UPI0004E9CC61|nr:uncharacterized protein CLAFUR5_20129 [Fulvia fulva]KAK4635664.1 hypothetical protein CLAFUR4_01608 [Fulvia fulva]KAK4637195.1 hypothetical protein CLAFUR0_01609 [Fulvia fulva]WMI38761.1 hypothetical protein CLAFUR5_20129 [Fulvia fulva]WPV09369.1 hypothetical protein CLAFUW4_01610 [Fulvia fulva]WPV24884.1 hypothetical protein CLAFUW7_01612 [Fulvia fulva]
MALLGRLLGICLLPLILCIALEQTLHLAEILIIACRYIASMHMIRSLLSACFDYLHDSRECDIVGSFPGSPLILSVLLEREIPNDEHELDDYRNGLKKAFYEEQCNAGRISFAQKLTFLNDPNALWVRREEDTEFAQKHQAAMAQYQAAPRIETTRQWTRRMREEREVAHDGIQRPQSTESASHVSPPRPSRSLQPYQGSAHAHALALVSDLPPQVPPKFKALRGLAPRDSKGNIVWGTDPVYEAYLMQEARAKLAPPGAVYRRWDSFTLTASEKVRLKKVNLADKLNLYSYSIRHWKEDVFQIHPPDNRSMFLDIQDGTYHEMGEWDYSNKIPLWRIISAIKAQTGGTGQPNTGSDTGNTKTFGPGFNNSGASTDNPTNTGAVWGTVTQPPPSVNTNNTNNGGGMFGAAPAPGQPGSLFGRPTGASDTGNNGGAPPFQGLPTQPSNNIPEPSQNNQTSQGTEAPPQSNNPLMAMFQPQYQEARIQEWLEDMKGLLDKFTYGAVKKDTNNPDDAWSAACVTAELYLRWIAEFVGDANGNWNKNLLPVPRAKKMGIKAPWWMKLGRELKKVHENSQTTADSPLEKLWVQFEKVHNMCREGITS